MNWRVPFNVTRRKFLQTGISGAAAYGLAHRATAVSAADGSGPYRISRGSPQIFVDLERVEKLENVRQLFHQAQKHANNPVLRGERPWEAAGYGFVHSVIYDEDDKLFKCWYQGVIGCQAGPVHSYGPHVLCYATSTDGIHWERPNLGLHEFEGSRDNNIVIPATYHNGKDHWESVLKDPFGEDDDARYKGFGWSSLTGGLHTMTSPDGLHWKHSQGIVVPGGDAQAMMIDPLRQRYVLFVRGGHPTGVHHSSDYVHWSPRDNDALRWDGPGSCYNQVGFAYGDTYLGILSYYQTHNEHLIDARLLTSRDGLHYKLAGPDALTRPALVPLGEIGDWDRLQTRLSGAPPVAVGDQLYIFYRGFSTSHNKQNRPRDQYFAGAMGMATLRRDGFASLAAGFDGGRVTTRPIVFEEGALRINAKARFHANVTVEVLDEREQPIRGYSAADCAPCREDSVDQLVTWKDNSDLNRLAGRPVKLRFDLVNARLYSYRVV